jgi:hypothetical protein
MRAKLKAIKMEFRKRMHDLQSGAVALAQDASAPEPEGRTGLGALHQPRRSPFRRSKTLHPLPCHRFDAKTRGRSLVR